MNTQEDTHEYETLLRENAAKIHQLILDKLSKGQTPWWTVLDMLEWMDDDTACFHTNAMKQELLDHPNCFQGSADDWTKRAN